MSETMSRTELLDRMERQVAEIDQLFTDTEHWNTTHPEEEAIEADPRGDLGRNSRGLRGHTAARGTVDRMSEPEAGDVQRLVKELRLAAKTVDRHLPGNSAMVELLTRAAAALTPKDAGAVPREPVAWLCEGKASSVDCDYEYSDVVRWKGTAEELVEFLTSEDMDIRDVRVSPLYAAPASQPEPVALGDVECLELITLVGQSVLAGGDTSEEQIAIVREWFARVAAPASVPLWIPQDTPPNEGEIQQLLDKIRPVVPRDTARLDWLEKAAHDEALDLRLLMAFNDAPEGSTVRDVIDAAMTDQGLVQIPEQIRQAVLKNQHSIRPPQDQVHDG